MREAVRKGAKAKQPKRKIKVQNPFLPWKSFYSGEAKAKAVTCTFVTGRMMSAGMSEGGLREKLEGI